MVRLSISKIDKLKKKNWSIWYLSNILVVCKYVYNFIIMKCNTRINAFNKNVFKVIILTKVIFKNANTFKQSNVG